MNELDLAGQPEKLHIQLSHFKQKYNWDCGVSCVLMVLTKEYRQHLIKNFLKICKEEGFNRSTWTIDLCYLLSRYGIKHVYYTITLGVHPGYRANSFYNHVLKKDESRVNTRFELAETNGINIKCASIKCVDLLNHLINGPIILLINSSLINCDVCKLNKISCELRKCIPWPTNYQGHYIVLCGYERNNRKIYYRNPTFSDRVCIMSLDVLEEARRSYGTDEDVIFIYN